MGNLAAYHGYNYESDPKVRNTAKILIDPLGHCQGGAEYFPQDLIAGRTALGLMQVCKKTLHLCRLTLSKFSH